jgi:hypothetical protein
MVQEVVEHKGDFSLAVVDSTTRIRKKPCIVQKDVLVILMG